MLAKPKRKNSERKKAWEQHGHSLLSISNIHVIGWVVAKVAFLGCYRLHFRWGVSEANAWARLVPSYCPSALLMHVAQKNQFVELYLSTNEYMTYFFGCAQLYMSKNVHSIYPSRFFMGYLNHLRSLSNGKVEKSSPVQIFQLKRKNYGWRAACADTEMAGARIRTDVIWPTSPDFVVFKKPLFCPISVPSWQK